MDSAGRDALERRFRPRRRWTGSWKFAVAISVVLHFSAVFVFRIVVYFPREDIRYYDFRLIEVPAVQAAAMPEDSSASIGDTLTLANRLPNIELPTVAFSELRRLRIRESGFEEASLYEELYGRERSPLARIGQGLQDLGTQFRRLTLGDGHGLDAPGPAEAVEEFRPARGYEGRIVWTARDLPRALLFSPPLQALWSLEGAETMEMVLQVDPSGRVTSVWSPEAAGSEVFDEVQAAVFQFRFEADDDAPGSEPATLIIRPESDGDGGL